MKRISFLFRNSFLTIIFIMIFWSIFIFFEATIASLDGIIDSSFNYIRKDIIVDDGDNIDKTMYISKTFSTNVKKSMAYKYFCTVYNDKNDYELATLNVSNYIDYFYSYRSGNKMELEIVNNDGDIIVSEEYYEKIIKKQNCSDYIFLFNREYNEYIFNEQDGIKLKIYGFYKNNFGETNRGNFYLSTKNDLDFSSLGMEHTEVYTVYELDRDLKLEDYDNLNQIGVINSPIIKEYQLFSSFMNMYKVIDNYYSLCIFSFIVTISLLFTIRNINLNKVFFTEYVYNKKIRRISIETILCDFLYLIISFFIIFIIFLLLFNLKIDINRFFNLKTFIPLIFGLLCCLLSDFFYILYIKHYYKL